MVCLVLGGGSASCADLFGRAAKGFTPLCSNYPQLAPVHTLWWVLGGGAPAHTSAKLHSI